MKINKLSIIFAVLLAGLSVFAYAKLIGPQTVTIVEYETQEIDENLWVSRSELLTQREITSRLREDSSRFVQELVQTRQKLLQSAEVTARLRLERDSLASLPNIIEIVDNKVDTTFTYVFNDSLLAVTASVKLDSTTLQHNVDLTQLRPIRLDVYTTRDPGAVYFYVESRDLQIEEINSTTTLDNPRYKWYHYLGAGIVSGVLIWELIR